MPFIGETAGLATAVLWALTSIFFARAGRMIGSFAVNKIRLLLALGIYALLMLATTGSLIPVDLNREQFMWLAASGVIGLVLGDGCGFKALVMIGPRLTTLLYACTPVITTVIAWFFLGERLRLIDLAGIALTLGGITWVVLERRYKTNGNDDLNAGHPDHGSLIKGVLLGVAAATGQAVGLVLAKQAMAHAGGTVEPLAAAYLRMAVSLPVIWGIAAARGRAGHALKAMRNREALGYCAAGAVVGPFLGVWMSLVAVKYIAAGLAATLNSTTPVMILPLVVRYYKEKLSARAVVGAMMTVLGVATIFLL